MLPRNKIYPSQKSVSLSKGPRFENQDAIQHVLRQLCETWWEYLSHYAQKTETLFGKPEYLWKDNERVIVSSLAASISRGFPDSLTVEELTVDKSANASEKGRKDLWASISDLPKWSGNFSFYLEAKKSAHQHTLDDLERFLVGNYGLPKLLSDFRKNRPMRTDQRSAYSNFRGRKHPHCVVGMLVIQMKDRHDDAGNDFFAAIKDILDNALDKPISSSAPKNTIGSTTTTTRKLRRFPAAALIVEPNGSHPGMVAILIVLAGTPSYGAIPN